ncbi:MAG: YccF domain-containing protein [Desulfovibrionaceae bacterium]|nr:YccF domain-containing protein [Desulfovibrionaceae bacterium]
MSIIGNIIWFLLGGVFLGIGWFLFGIICFISIIGIPWGRACFTMANFCFFPFGREAVRRNYVTGRGDIGTGALGVIGNIVWCLLGGIWLCIGHLFSGLLCCITIIGIPFGLQHFKIAVLALMPIGMTIVPKETLEKL